jgi:hypothetical protein
LVGPTWVRLLLLYCQPCKLSNPATLLT